MKDYYCLWKCVLWQLAKYILKFPGAYISDEDLASRLYKELLQFNNKKTENSLKIDKKHFSKENMQGSIITILNTISHQENVNQNQKEIPVYSH